jgi:hexosaminidase
MHCQSIRIASACLLFSVAAVSGLAADGANGDLPLVPQPAKVERLDGKFTLTPETLILIDKDAREAGRIGQELADRLNRSTGLSLRLKVAAEDVKSAKSAIILTLNHADASLGEEGYRLDIAPGKATVAAGKPAGLFYGVQTLLQLLPPKVFSPTKAEGVAAWEMPAVRIQDQPRFRWRHLMLDVSRHFLNKEEVKSFLDLMAQHKYNTLHWHLTDCVGWRIEIKKYPKLTSIAAWRKDIGFGLDPKASTAYAGDGQYGGFYTQNDIRDIVDYARARYITIVPEIEMPGHSAAPLTVYPEFSCFGGPYNRDGGPMGIYCAGNDETFTFLENVLAEVIGLFPGKYIHIGGDEVDKATWNKCPKCQARIQKEGLKDANELQSYFVKRIEKFINSKGKTIIGWDEILEGGLAPNAAVMSWRGVDGGIAAANADHDVVMTPTSHCYFDYYQAKEGEPKAIGGFLPLEMVYGFEPVPAALSAEKAKHILGVGGNLWSEFFPNYRHVQYMAFPRACALAEVSWTDPKLKDWGAFQRRLATHLERLKAEGVNYRQP